MDCSFDVIFFIMAVYHVTTVSQSEAAQGGAAGNCTASICRYGSCQIKLNTTVCSCGPYLLGPVCQYVNLNVPTKTWKIDGLVFTWTPPLELSQKNVYSILYYDRTTKEKLYSKPVEDASGVSQVNVTGLTLGGFDYVVCMVDNVVLLNRSEQVLITSVLKPRSGWCVTVRTGFDGRDPYTKAAIGATVFITGCVLFLITAKCISDCRNQENRKRLLEEVMGHFDRLVIKKLPSMPYKRRSKDSRKQGQTEADITVTLENESWFRKVTKKSKGNKTSSKSASSDRKGSRKQSAAETEIALTSEEESQVRKDLKKSKGEESEATTPEGASWDRRASWEQEEEGQWDNNIPGIAVKSSGKRKHREKRKMASHTDRKVRFEDNPAYT